jgi:hypothetical protein
MIKATDQSIDEK